MFGPIGVLGRAARAGFDHAWTGSAESAVRELLLPERRLIHRYEMTHEAPAADAVARIGSEHVTLSGLLTKSGSSSNAENDKQFVTLCSLVGDRDFANE